MDYQKWIEMIKGFGGIYAFDILPDGSFSEIRLMAANQVHLAMNMMNPDAPAFYPGIPYREYFMDLNFESFVYRSGSTGQPLYSYVNARGVWLKGFYLPVVAPGEEPAAMPQVPQDNVPESEQGSAPKTAYVLYSLAHSEEAETEAMSKHPAEVSDAVLGISVKLHKSQDYLASMASVVSDIKDVCAAERCSIFTVNGNNQSCELISEDGIQTEMMKKLCAEMDRTPYEIAQAWENDLALSDCLILDDLEVIAERDPVWYRSLVTEGIRNIILFEIRFNHMLTGFIWAANFDAERMMRIKETLELTTFFLGAVIANHQLISGLEERGTVDALTQLGNRNAMNDRIDALLSQKDAPPKTMGVVFADLNGLKIVNDEKGHDAGDRLLFRAASLLNATFGDYEIYRAGGDEFVVLCPDIGKDGLLQLVARLRTLSDNTEDVSFAIGCAHADGTFDISRMLREADEDMYRDKAEYYRKNPDKDRRKNRR